MSINTNSIITFNDKNNVNVNKIQNTFIPIYNNTTQEYEVISKQEGAVLTNLTTSPVFNDNAVKFYNKVANYVDSQKIEDNIGTSDFLECLNSIKLVIILVCLVVNAIVFLLGYVSARKQYINANHDWIIYLPYVILLVSTIIVVIFWSCSVKKPIHDQVEKVKDWNNFITGEGGSNIEVIKRVNGEDKKHFKSSNNFSTYFHNSPSKTFSSYFYYLHFNNILVTSKKTIKQNEQVKKDYDEFNKTKEKYNVIITRIGFKIVSAILFFLLMLIAIGYLVISFISLFDNIKNLINPLLCCFK